MLAFGRQPSQLCACPIADAVNVRPESKRGKISARFIERGKNACAHSTSTITIIIEYILVSRPLFSMIISIIVVRFRSSLATHTHTHMHSPPSTPQPPLELHSHAHTSYFASFCHFPRKNEEEWAVEKEQKIRKPNENCHRDHSLCCGAWKMYVWRVACVCVQCNFPYTRFDAVYVSIFYIWRLFSRFFFLLCACGRSIENRFSITLTP